MTPSIQIYGLLALSLSPTVFGLGAYVLNQCPFDISYALPDAHGAPGPTETLATGQSINWQDGNVGDYTNLLFFTQNFPGGDLNKPAGGYEFGIFQQTINDPALLIIMPRIFNGSPPSLLTDYKTFISGGTLEDQVFYTCDPGACADPNQQYPTDDYLRVPNGSMAITLCA